MPGLRRLHSRGIQKFWRWRSNPRTTVLWSGLCYVDYVVVGYPVDQRVSLTAGYELAVDDIRGTLFTAHTIKFGAGIKLN